MGQLVGFQELDGSRPELRRQSGREGQRIVGILDNPMEALQMAETQLRDDGQREVGTLEWPRVVLTVRLQCHAPSPFEALLRLSLFLFSFCWRVAQMQEWPPTSLPSLLGLYWKDFPHPPPCSVAEFLQRVAE